MDLIIGGAWQGKREYAIEHFGFNEEDIFICTEDGNVDLGAKCIYGIENYVLWCVKNGVTPREGFRSDAVVICRDISSGIVPVDPVIRKWREDYGRYCQRLAKKSDTVTRMFCGLPQRIK